MASHRWNEFGLPDALANAGYIGPAFWFSSHVLAFERNKDYVSCRLFHHQGDTFTLLTEPDYPHHMCHGEPDADTVRKAQIFADSVIDNV